MLPVNLKNRVVAFSPSLEILLTRGTGFLLFLWISLLFPLSSIGKWGLVLTILNLVEVFALQITTPFLQREVSLKTEQKFWLPEFKLAGLHLSFFLTPFVILLLLAGISTRFDYLTERDSVFILTGFVIQFLPVFLSSVCFASRRFFSFLMLKTSVPVLLLIFSLTANSQQDLLSQWSEWYLIAHLINLLLSIFVFFFNYKNIRFFRIRIQQVFAYNFPVSLSTLISVLINRLDILVFSIFLPASALGIYYSARRFVQINEAGLQVISRLSYHPMVKGFGIGQIAGILVVAKLWIKNSLIIQILLFTLILFPLFFIYPKEKDMLVLTYLFLSVSIFIRCFSQQYGMALDLAGFPKDNMKYLIFGLIIHLLLYMFWVSIAGYWGIVTTVPIAYLAGFWMVKKRITVLSQVNTGI
ncbi:MAG: hypothetical protein J0L62_07480 [Bacteroidetes bacterium]|nr:hypothetical protein [Bacteroidota bacterium]